MFASTFGFMLEEIAGEIKICQKMRSSVNFVLLGDLNHERYPLIV